MQCSIGEPRHLRTFSKALLALSRVGDYLYWRVTDENTLVVTSVNNSRSAFAKVTFQQRCFNSLCLLSRDASQSQQSSASSLDVPHSCKVHVKSAQMLLKPWSNVEFCDIVHDVSVDPDHLILNLRCRFGVSRQYRIPLYESDTLQTTYQATDARNVLECPGKVLLDVAGNFARNFHDICLCAKQDKVYFRNYVPDQPEQNKVPRTELCLLRKEFSRYDISIESEVAFGLKELRALLSFVALDPQLSVSVHFDLPGKPTVFKISVPQLFEIEWLLATLGDESPSTTQQAVSPSLQISFRSGRQSSPPSPVIMPRQRAPQPPSSPPPVAAAVSVTKHGHSDHLPIVSAAMPSVDAVDTRTDVEMIDDDPDIVPDSPPNKRLRAALFRGLISQGSPERNPRGRPAMVLAEDSDPD